MINNRETLFDFMSQGAMVITPNNRLSNQLLQDYYAHQASNIADKPLCMPYQAFLNDLYTRARHMHPHEEHPILLSNLQQRHIWQQTLSSQSNYPCNEGLLHEVQEAWARCQQWQIDINAPVFSHTPQTYQFQKWHNALQKTLTDLGAITNEQLVNRLIGYNEIFNASMVIWVCFDDYTPQQRLIQQTYDAQECVQFYYDLTPKPLTAQRYRAQDRQDEYLQLINWLKSRLAAGDERIGVVVPDLQAQHLSLQRLIQRHIPQSQFNISLGKALTDYPLVTHALTWLCLDKQTISNHHARLLLHSPYLSGSKHEFTLRSHALHDNKILQETDIPFNALIQAFELNVPKLAQLLTNLAEYPQEATPQEWIDCFKARLSALGFPGDYPLNSTAYQCFQCFNGLFDELLQLTVICPRMTAQAALDALKHAAQSTVFQIRKLTTPIQIQGLLEASGCTFDSVWVCGLTDQCLPQKTNLSAFIPLDLQRDHQMPHAVSAREYQLAQQLLQRLQYGSERSVFSYPRITGDIPNMPSPLIIELPAFEITETPSQTPAASLLVKQEEIYTLPLLTSEIASGGTSLLANQAKCPFRAFAAHRLHARAELKQSTGPDPSERGQILHRIMELLWQHLGSQKQLNDMSLDALNYLIETSILNALTPFTQSRRLSFSPLVQAVEINRLQRLVTAALEWEKQRPAFVIEALEQTFSITLAGIDFRVRIDRLDKLESDDKWVIDYKTSIPIAKPWNEERPEAPQLLLYALLDEQINALLFVQLKSGRLTCNGLSEDVIPLKGISALKKNEHWNDYRQEWHKQLSALAHEFSVGYCPPQPNRSSTCEQCEFQNLCRIRNL